MRPARGLVALLLSVSLAWPVDAHAAPHDELKAELERLKRDVARAGRAYDDAYWALDETMVRLARVDRRARIARRQLARARARLAVRAREMYIRDTVGLIGALVTAESLDALIERAAYLERIAEADAKVISDVERWSRDLARERSILSRERRERVRALKVLERRRDALIARLRAKESRFRALRQRLARIRSTGARAASGAIAAPGPSGMVFPVLGAYFYSDTWGASRSGGRRRHRGTDIMAPRGTPLVAIVDGRVSASVNRLGGRCIWLSGSNGWRFYYAHLDRWAVRSGYVRAGQTIGYVGSTGNAAGGTPHLHLEIHSPGRGAVNPYPYLRRME